MTDLLDSSQIRQIGVTIFQLYLPLQRQQRDSSWRWLSHLASISSAVCELTA